MSGNDAGVSYRIECLECGAVEFGEPGTDVEFDKQYHRERCDPDAEFDVVYEGERIMQSPLTNTWYLVTKWRDKGVGKAQAVEKEEIADEDVPDVIDRLEAES